MTVICVTGQTPSPKSGEELVTTVLNNCVEMACVKQNVLLYLDNLLNIQSDARNAKVVLLLYKKLCDLFSFLITENRCINTQKGGQGHANI